MADHDITVTLKNGVFTYKPSATHHVLHGETISWTSPSGAISVDFPYGNPTDSTPPFTAPQGQPTKTVELPGHHGEPKGTRYKYDVTINGKTDDPQIIFDDAGAFINDLSLKSFSNAAQTTFEGVLADLEGIKAALKRDPDGVFFPGGINNIQVQVTGFGVTANITVSGPAATVLSSLHLEKK